MCLSIQFNCNELVYYSYYHTEFYPQYLSCLSFNLTACLVRLNTSFNYWLKPVCRCTIMKVLNFSYVNTVLENCVSTETVVYDYSFTNNYTTDYLSVEPTTVD